MPAICCRSRRNFWIADEFGNLIGKFPENKYLPQTYFFSKNFIKFISWFFLSSFLKNLNSDVFQWLARCLFFGSKNNCCFSIKFWKRLPKFFCLLSDFQKCRQFPEIYRQIQQIIKSFLHWSLSLSRDRFWRFCEWMKKRRN